MNSETINARLADIRHLALDMDGTIYKGGTLFDCTLPFLAKLKELEIGFTFLTNNSSRSACDTLTHLEKMNLPVQADQIYTAGMATLEYLRTHHPEYGRLFILGTESLRQEFSEAGFTVVGDGASDTIGDITTEEPDAVVVGFDTELIYRRLCAAGYWIDRGKPFFATHPDILCPTDQETLLVDCGAICACLTQATGRSPDVVLGKPHPIMLDGILRRQNLQPSQLAMIGDRLSTDIAMAKIAGTLGILVLTGEATAEDAKSSPARPDLVVADLAEVGRLLQGKT